MDSFDQPIESYRLTDQEVFLPTFVSSGCTCQSIKEQRRLLNLPQIWFPTLVIVQITGSNIITLMTEVKEITCQGL